MIEPFSLETGDICFIMHHDSWLSRSIAWFMSSEWSHAAVAIDEGTMGGYLMETTDLEIAVGLFARYVEDQNVSIAVFRAESLSYSDRSTIKSQSKRLEGKIYGYLQLLSLGIRRLLMRVGVRIPNFIKLGTICNQVVTLAYEGINKDPFTKLDPKGVDTDELFQALLESKDFKLIFQKRSVLPIKQET